MEDWIVAAWDWIVANITNLKDFLWIVFSFIATLVAILTYRRARYTLLQPLRTEVIKRQTDLLVALLDFFDSSILFSVKLDYFNIICINVVKLLEKQGHKFNDNSIFDDIEKQLAGALFDSNIEVQSSNILNQSNEQTGDNHKELEYKYDVNIAHLNEDKIEQVYFTKQYFFCTRDLKQFRENPFMPKEIKKLLKNLEKDIAHNLSIIMKVLNEFYQKIHSENYNFNNGVSVNDICNAIHSRFIEEHKNHDNSIRKVKELIGKYLMVDKKW